MERPCTSMGAARQRIRRIPSWTVLHAAACGSRKLRAAAAVRFGAFRVTRSPLPEVNAVVSTDKDYEAGRYNQPFRAGGDWDAYRQGQADRARWNRRTPVSPTTPPGSAPGFDAPAAGGGGAGGIVALAALVIGIVLAVISNFWALAGLTKMAE